MTQTHSSNTMWSDLVALNHSKQHHWHKQSEESFTSSNMHTEPRGEQCDQVLAMALFYATYMLAMQ